MTDPVSLPANLVSPSASHSSSSDWAARFTGLLARVADDQAAFRAAGGHCVSCRDTGRDRGAWQPCLACARGAALLEQEREARLRARLAAADVAPFAGRGLDTWPGPPELGALLRRWASDWPLRLDGRDRPWLLLHGPTGTGKSSLAAALLVETLATGELDGWRCVVPDLLRRLRPVPDQDEALAVRAERAPLLVLDDIGVTKPSAWVEERLYGIINTRYERRRWTVLTSNLSPDDGTLAAQLGPRIFWRMHELALSVEVSAGNLRDS